jgi:predicted permease
MGNFRQDLQFAVRMLFKNPLFTGAAVLTLALGIGLNATVFSAVHALLFSPLPGIEAEEELVQLYRTYPGMIYGSNSIPHYQDLRDRLEIFDGDVASWKFVTVALSADGRNERLLGQMVSANFFDVLGAPPVLGRGFLPEEAVGEGAHPVVVLGHSFWQTRFGADPDVIGRTIQLNGQPWTIVGVASEEFRGAMRLLDPPFYAPVMMQPNLDMGGSRIELRGSNSNNVVARLPDGATLAQAEQSADQWLLAMREEYPDHYDESGIHMVMQSGAGIHPMFRSAQTGMATITMLVVGFLLFIACINVANLFLARAGERQREMGIRLSLGARRGRLVSQLLTEAILFSVVAGGAGLLLAYWSVGVLNGIRLPMDFPVDMNISVSGPVLAFTAGISVLTGVLFGLAPALQASKPEMVTALKGEASLVGGSRFRLTNLLVVAQTALSILLLISAGLFLRGLQAATAVDKGFDESNQLVATVDPSMQGYDRERTSAFYDQLYQELRALPGVQSVGFAAIVPLTLNSSDRGVSVPGYEPGPEERMSLRYNMIRGEYFEAMGVEIEAGRVFTPEDNQQDAAPVIIVNRVFADRFWPGEDPIGKIVETAGAERVVVGIAENGKYQSLGEDPSEYMYFPHEQVYRHGLTAHIRTAGPPEDLAPLVREAVGRLDPNMPVSDLRTMTNQLGVALFPARLGSASLGLFGILGLILAAVGIYGVMAYTVAQKGREIGIRVALGAQRSQVVGMVLLRGMKLVAVGVVLGLAAAAGLSYYTAGLLYGVEAVEPITFLGVPAVLGLTALTATYLPARRAAGVDPMRALRSD